MLTIETMSAQDIDSLAENNARTFKKDGLKTNQIRNVYAAITRLRQDFKESKKGIDSTKEVPEAIQRELIFLKPKLAYSAGRQKAVRTTFYPFMKKHIEEVLSATDKSKALNNFFALVEAVVAYHKFHSED
jgi:CRISPR-associated protein Csm2